MTKDIARDLRDARDLLLNAARTIEGLRTLAGVPEYVWVVRRHDKYENASMTISVWTNEAHAKAYRESSDHEIDRIRLNTPKGYDQ